MASTVYSSSSLTWPIKEFLSRELSTFIADFAKAAAGGNNEIVARSIDDPQFALIAKIGHPTCTAPDRDKILLSAVEGGHTEVVKLLAPHVDPISIPEAIRRAVRKDYPQIVSTLAPHIQVSQLPYYQKSELNFGFEDAAEKGLEMAGPLIPHVTPFYLKQGLRAAATNGRLDLVQAILEDARSNQIATPEIEAARHLASQSHHSTVVAALNEYLRIHRPTRCQRCIIS